jgi:hypothetical protein
MKHKLIKYLVLSFSCIFLLSCTEEINRDEDQTLNIPDESKLILTNFFFLDPDFKRLNFPFWLDKDKVVEQNINTLLVTKMKYKDSLPVMHSKHEFEFYETGSVKNIVRVFYDNEVIIKQDLISYKNSTDDFMTFQFKEQSSKKYSNKDFTDYITFIRSEEHNNNFIVFMSTDEPNQPSELYIINEEKQNISFIDNLIKEYNNAYFYYGDPKTPKTSFYQKDLVQRSGEIFYSYYANDVLKKIRKNYNNYFEESFFIYDSIGRFDRIEHRTFTNDSTKIDHYESRVKYSSTESTLPLEINLSVIKGDSVQQIIGNILLKLE